MTYVNVFGEEVVGGLVLLQQVGVDAAAGSNGAEEETKEAVEE